jgi:hydrogenase nickel incorporation protein HypA/HybF
VHELSLCEGVRGVIEDAARREGFRRVTRVRLEIGRLAGVEPDALRFGFDAAMRGSIAEGATLEVIDLPGRAMCFGCGETVEIVSRLDDCPRCGGGRLAPAGGDEMRVRDLEVV